MGMPALAIETEGLTKDYPSGFLHLKKKRSLEGLSLQVETGEVFGFLGPNGAGKSTTIKLLVGLIFPTAGSARILGSPVSQAKMRRGIGYLPENPYFYDYLTAAELLDYFARLQSVPVGDRASYGLTNCAERTAIFSAVAQLGPAMEIEDIAVVNAQDVPCSPCGACRQVIYEFGPKAMVYFQGPKGWKCVPIRSLLPEGFRLK